MLILVALCEKFHELLSRIHCNRMKLVAAPFKIYNVLQSYNVSLKVAAIVLMIKQMFCHFLKTSKF